MISVRHNVFETNSSSCHCVTLGKKHRPKEEFPVPDENGNIVLELDMVNHVLDFSGFKTFKDYLMLAIIYLYNGGKISGIDYASSANSQKKLIKWINLIYAMVGLPSVKKLIVKWQSFVEFSNDGYGDCHGYHDHSDYISGMQSGYRLDAFFQSICEAVEDAEQLPDDADALVESWDKADYKENIALYNSTLAMVYDTTSEIREDH